MALFESECVGGCPPAAPDDSSQLPAGCEADVNGDGRVNVGDILLVLGAFGWRPADQESGCGAAASAAGGPSRPSGLPEDINRDCAVGVADLLLALSAFGIAC